MLISSLLRHTAKLERQKSFGHLGWFRGSMGALIGIALAGVVNLALFGSDGGIYPLLVAPLGASAVLVFAVPASPLAQPWPFIGGDILSAAVGLVCGMLIGEPLFSAAIAVAAAIGVMTICRCLHPPGGACALLCALGSAGTDGWGLDYLLPIAINVLILGLVGWLYNNFTGHAWPHIQLPVPQPRETTDNTYTREDIREVLDEWDEVLDVDIDDLDAVFKAVERKAAKRKAAEVLSATSSRKKQAA